mmetsp:Transcript_85977/g.199900  ORF Transcript_85977/g.199900 Transcript_85977/m.199900 type:complete len:344 (-) Transcript_85977:1322-2353(-)
MRSLGPHFLLQPAETMLKLFERLPLFGHLCQQAVCIVEHAPEICWCGRPPLCRFPAPQKLPLEHRIQRGGLVKLSDHCVERVLEAFVPFLELPQHGPLLRNVLPRLLESCFVRLQLKVLLIQMATLFATQRSETLLVLLGQGCSSISYVLNLLVPTLNCFCRSRDRRLGCCKILLPFKLHVVVLPKLLRQLCEEARPSRTLPPAVRAQPLGHLRRENVTSHGAITLRHAPVREQLCTTYVLVCRLERSGELNWTSAAGCWLHWKRAAGHLPLSVGSLAGRRGQRRRRRPSGTLRPLVKRLGKAELDRLVPHGSGCAPFQSMVACTAEEPVSHSFPRLRGGPHL